MNKKEVNEILWRSIYRLGLVPKNVCVSVLFS